MVVTSEPPVQRKTGGYRFLLSCHTCLCDLRMLCQKCQRKDCRHCHGKGLRG